MKGYDEWRLANKEDPNWAHYVCLDCGFEWWVWVEYADECPNCGSGNIQLIEWDYYPEGE